MKILYAADSTVQFNSFLTYPQTGISQGLRLYVRDEIEIKSYARNGRSTRSFLKEGRFDRILRDIEPGDFVFIQFGHNDQKVTDPERYTDPFTDFKENVEFMIRKTKEAGGIAVVISPIYRRYFEEDGHIMENVHKEYPLVLRSVSKEEGVLFIDLCEITKNYLDKIGDEASKALYMNFGPGLYDNYPEGKNDNTHLRYPGAVKYAGFLAEELKKAGGIYEKLIIDKWPLTEMGPWE